MACKMIDGVFLNGIVITGGELFGVPLADALIYAVTACILLLVLLVLVCWRGKKYVIARMKRLEMKKRSKQGDEYQFGSMDLFD